MTAALSLPDLLAGRTEPAGYVSFLSALVHHGVLIDSPALIQIASPERAGRCRDVVPGPVDFHLIPRDLHFGWAWERFEGVNVPVASPEKALVDWLHLVEEECLDPRLEEIEWDALDLGRLEALCREAGVEPEPLLGQSRRLLETSHVQWRLRWEGAPPR